MTHIRTRDPIENTRLAGWSHPFSLCSNVCCAAAAAYFVLGNERWVCRKGLVSSRPEDEPLWIRVARGTDVMERHEIALVNLCTSPDSNQKEMEQCVLDFIASGYSLDDNNINNDGEIDPATLASCSDTDTECLLDDLWSNWGEDPLPQPADFAVQEAASAAAAAAAKQKPKPWSSRSSPSGTYVRDPRTGKVRNIDA